ncbi:C45 family autoproteolytic acyltransferase/hydrolase [Chloroflexota bacterium]
MKKTLLLLMLLVILLFPTVGCTKESPTEFGNIYQIDSATVVVLRGSYREMGEQYGRLLNDQIVKLDIHGMLLAMSLPETDPCNLEMYTKSKQESMVPANIRDFLQGIGEGAPGVTYDEVLYCNVISSLFFKAGCSALAVCGSRAANEELVFGRNFDLFPLANTNATDCAVITVMHPDDGTQSTINFGYAGLPGAVSLSINDEGMLGGINFSPSTDMSCDFMPLPLTLWRGLQQYETLQEVMDYLLETPRAGGTNLQLADPATGTALSLELSANHHAVRYPEEDILIATNYYVDSTMESYQMAALGVERYARLVDLVDEHPQPLSTDDVKAFLHASGVFQRGGTVQTQVYDPVADKIHFWLYGWSDYIELDTGDLFNLK